MRQKQLLFQAEQINLFQSKWSGLKKMVILTENSYYFVNLFSFQFSIEMIYVGDIIDANGPLPITVGQSKDL